MNFWSKKFTFIKTSTKIDNAMNYYGINRQQAFHPETETPDTENIRFPYISEQESVPVNIYISFF